MKTLKIAAATVLVLGLGTASYAGMGKCGAGKCGGGMQAQGMKGDFATQKSMMLKRLDKMKNCVESADSKSDLQACKQKMMQKMQQMKAQKQSMKCGAGKCGGR